MKNNGNKQKKQSINSKIKNLIDNIPDFEDNNDERSVKIIIEERKAIKKGDLWYGEVE